MVDFEHKEHYDVYDFKNIIKLLRSEGGCPWDREQTHESIRRNFIEEAYEAVEAIDEKSTEHLKEELGDVLMQVIFHAQMEDEIGTFDLDDVADGACKKLIYRHPHVFGDVNVANSDEVLVNWDALKKVEKDQKTVADTLDSVARNLPGLWRAEKVQKKAAKVGFDWQEVDGALDKLEEELRELREAIKTGNGAKEELGDLIFSAVNVARFIKADPEEAVNSTTDKFIERFRRLEEAAKDRGGIEKMSFEDMDELYEEVKAKLLKEKSE